MFSVYVIAFFGLFVACSARSLYTPMDQSATSTLPYSTTWFNQKLSHFSYKEPQGSMEFKQRVLFNTQYWNGNGTHCPGPILFYTGNESPVTDYWDNSGFITEVLAPKLNAAVYFVEHRYFGESMPFGKSSWTPENIQYLSAEQALADYAHFISELKRGMPWDCPVFAFGGSYGGMLTAWIRAKYPWLVMGSLAASAPFAFPGTKEAEPYAFMDACENTWLEADAACPGVVSAGLRKMDALGDTVAGRQQISKDMETCKPLQSKDEVTALIQYIQSSMVDMTMLDYDTKADYGIVLPAWPVNKTCEALVASHADPVRAFGIAMKVYYNATGTRQCLDIVADQPSFAPGDGWPYLACTEMYFASEQRGMWFPHTTQNLQAYTQTCQQEFNVSPRYNWAATQFGGFDFDTGVSNIIFSNGKLDPWHALGVKESLGPRLPAVIIGESAHHGDLRGPTPNDPQSLTDARKIEESYITKWIGEWFASHDYSRKK